MPKLLGWREHTPMNVYDSFSPRDRDMVASGLRLFGMSNIGDLARSNLHTVGYARCGSGTWQGPPRDATAVLFNWYARDSVSPLSRLPSALRDKWEAWSHVTTLELLVGDRTVLSEPLDGIMLRKSGERYAEAKLARTDPGLDTVSDAIRREYLNYSVTERVWASVPEEERERWRRVAWVALRELSMPVLALIPVRQSFGVHVHTQAEALRALRTELEVVPDDVARQLLVWVHLEGGLTHDVA